MNVIEVIQNLASPALKKQNAYKKEAKALGLLSAKNLINWLDVNEIEFDKISNQKGFKLSSTTSYLTAETLNEADENGILKLTDKILYSDKNFHNLKITNDGYDCLAQNRSGEVTMYPEYECLNVDHEQAPQFVIGTYEITKCDKQNGQIIGNIELDINHPAFASQRYVLEKDPELSLGLSIEIGGECSYNKLTKEIIYTNPSIQGLATTLIPSAPATLTNLNMPTNNLATIEPIDESNIVEVYDTVLTKDNELMRIVEIITDTSFTYKDIICSDTDPVALLYNPAYWDWENEGGNYDFANVSTLTKVKYRENPTALSKFKESIQKDLLEFKQKLNIPLSESQQTLLSKNTQPMTATNLNTEATTQADPTPTQTPSIQDLESKLASHESKIDLLEAKLDETTEALNTVIELVSDSTKKLTAVNKLTQNLAKPSSISNFSM